jgi:hypothetical protein
VRDTSGGYEIIGAADVRAALTRRPEFASVWNRMLRLTASEADRPPSLKDILTDEGLLEFRSTLSNSDLVLIPCNFVLAQTGLVIVGRVTFHLFDLHSGALVYRKYWTFNVQQGGGVGMGGMVSMVDRSTRIWDYLVPEAVYCTGLLAGIAARDLRRLVNGRLD